MNKLQPFSKKGYRDEPIIPCAFDTETNGLGGELLFISACTPMGTHTFKGVGMVADLFCLLAEYPYPCVWYAHHAQYDWRYLLSYIVENDIPIDISMRTETDIYQLSLFIDDKRIVMRDSMAVFPGTLREFAKSFVPELPKGDIDFEKETFNPDDESHVAYAIRDAQILKLGLPRFNAMLQKHFGVCLGHTTAGTALKAWQATIPEGIYYAPSKWGKREQFIRESYYGGLVFLTRTDEVSNAVTFDINSSYPHAMCTKGVPWGSCIASDNYKNGLMGIYRIRCRAPRELVVPILPRRDERGYMRWHGGEFETICTNVEITFAERHGYEIIEVMEGLCWEKTIFPFNDFIEKCKTIRRDYKGQPEETLAKLMQNSLYGKYGSRRERLTVFSPSCDEETIDASPIDNDGFFWMKKEFAEDLRCIPEWAVFITAHARLKLLNQIYKVGVHNVIYGDTDSLTVQSSAADKFDEGNEYGQWKREKQWSRFRAIAPKVYSGQLSTGQFKGAAKGLPKKRMSDDQWAALLAGDQVSVDYLTLPSLRVAMKKGVEPAKEISRISTDIAHSANWELHGTNVRPRMASTL